MLTGLLVAARIVSNPVSNVFQKQLAQRGASPVFIIAATHALLSLACLALLAAWPQPWPQTGFWRNISLAAVIAVAGNIALVYALREADLSVLGPINAYKVLLSVPLGAAVIGEVPTGGGLAGVLLIVAGSYGVVERAGGQRRIAAIGSFLRQRAVHLRFAALACSATEAVFLKKALLVSSPLLTFAGWALLGLPVAALAACGACRKEVSLARANSGRYLALAGTTAAMQLATLYTFGRLQVGYSLALFQLSALLSVLLGYRYFAERQIGRRIAGAIVMIAGATLIVLQTPVR